MYLLGFKAGERFCGNQGTQITHYKSDKNVRKAAEQFANIYQHDEVWGLTDYPQSLCEAEGQSFFDYVRTHGRALI